MAQWFYYRLGMWLTTRHLERVIEMYILDGVWGWRWDGCVSA